MNLNEALTEITYWQEGVFPKAALQYLIAHPDDSTPELLKILEEINHDPSFLIEDETYMANLYAYYLLAQFREARAYRLLVDFFALSDEEIVLESTGDFVTEDLGRALASVYDGDDGPLRRLIEDTQVNEYVRSAAMQALVILHLNGRKTREEVIDYFRFLFDEGLEREPSYAWDALIATSIDLYPEELYDEIKEAFVREMAVEFLTDLPYVDKLMAEGKEATLARSQKDPQLRLIDDTIAELEGWAAFRPPPPPLVRSPSLSGLPPVPSLAPSPVPPAIPEIVPNTVKNNIWLTTGRNDPCPCGSGKKYKKCCWSKRRRQ
jgi:hypothetical protein